MTTERNSGDLPPTYEDRVVDIGPGVETAVGSMVGFYSCLPRRTADGLGFNMYAGYYYYLVTAATAKRFLRAKTQKDLEVRSNYTWVQVPDLAERLQEVLTFNLRESPMCLTWLTKHRYSAVWEGDKLSKSEERWLAVVNAAFAQIYAEGEAKRKAPR